ncbi:filamentation induced by cAMP protein fic [Hyphomicrobium denitrificans 1NES1]|uniref:protein adenylyltransferase n=1 Tax=Hyphomicrobium denitrificans 1NES1 TaxID=670307 RepID=N0B1X9_9HYPH|nr:Fic family protein [Hyphomicrobium denitrificans]AGK56948.1 filamentation induced by cAMP protein fic [Hyphomicrobium denitrificans 1NES1]
MYEAERDPYCHSGSSVLKNKAGLTSKEALERFETAMTFARSEEPLPNGRFSATHYRAIHFHLFQDVFPWAGKYRTVRIAKGQSVFCYPENIAAEMTRVFAGLKQQRYLCGLGTSEFAAAAAHFLAELNAIHPFREGNGRTQLTFLTLLAHQAGHPLDLDKLEPDAVLQAMIASFGGDEIDLTNIIADLAS